MQRRVLALVLLAAVPHGWAQSLHISVPPQPLSVRSGETAVFNVGTTGTVATSYTWLKNGAPMQNDERISGTQGPRLSFSPVSVVDAGQYTVRVSDGTNTLLSSAAGLVVDVVVPTFTNSPADVRIESGGTAQFSAKIGGNLPVQYAWQRDGVPLVNGGRIAGVDTSTLTLSGVVPEDNGWYSLTASNAAGCVSSEPARLRVFSTSTFAAAAGFDECVWSSGGDASWLTQTSVSRDGNALSNDAIGHNQSTYLETTVFGPGNVEFYWKVSSEGADPLQFLVNGTSWTQISGEVDWAKCNFHLGSGPQVLRWQYRKDGSVVKGADRAYLDQIVFAPTPQTSLEKALNAPPLPVLTYGQDRWFGQTLTNSDGLSAARNGYIGHNESSTVETKVSGPGWISYHWRVSSEGADPFEFLVDGTVWEGIAGEKLWTNCTYHIPWGIHTLSWRYRKDGSIVRGNDTAWLDQVSYVSVGLSDLAQASDMAGAAWTTDGNGRWFGQNEYAADGEDALQSSPIGANQSTFVDTSVTGPGTLVYKWKVSSEGADVLRFLVDSNEWARVSGEVDWTSVTNVIRPGLTSLRWQYSKDGSIIKGADAGWVDQVSFTPAPPLPQALNAPALTWTVGGDVGWFPEMVTTHDGVAAAHSGDITHNQQSELQTSVTGPGSGSFYWKVSSEGSDPLIFLTNGVEVARISGDRDWALQTFEVPAGNHILTWRYQKDYSVDRFQDAAWLDQFTFTRTGLLVTQPVLNGESFGVTVQSTLGRSYRLEYKNDLRDQAWMALPGIPGTGSPLLLMDAGATNAQRFYRVRVE